MSEVRTAITPLSAHVENIFPNTSSNNGSLLILKEFTFKF